MDFTQTIRNRYRQVKVPSIKDLAFGLKDNKYNLRDTVQRDYGIHRSRRIKECHRLNSEEPRQHTQVNCHLHQAIRLQRLNHRQ